MFVKISEYEKQRMKRIEENKAKMLALRIPRLKESLTNPIEKKMLNSNNKRNVVREKEHLAHRDAKEQKRSSEGDNYANKEERVTRKRLAMDMSQSNIRTHVGQDTGLHETLSEDVGHRRISRAQVTNMHLPYAKTQVAVSQSPLRHTPQVSNNIEPLQNDMLTVSGKQAKGKRGPTTLKWLFGSKIMLKLEWNERNQVVGPGQSAVTFTDAIGVIMKTCREINWTLDWPKVHDDAKEKIWERLTEHFELDITKKDPTLSYYCAPSFRNKKKTWKRDYYKKHHTDEERLLNKPPELSDSQWAELVLHWGTEKQKTISEENSRHRREQKVKDTMGRKSFPRAIHELEVEEGEHPSRGRFFAISHTSKRTHDALDDTSREYISKMQALAGVDENGTPLPITDEHYDHVMPPERHGRMRGMGPGVTPSRYFGSTRDALLGNMEKKIQDEINQMVEERVEERTKKMQDDIDKLVEAQVRAGMEEMRAIMMQQLYFNDTIDTIRMKDTENTILTQDVLFQTHHKGTTSRKCKLANWQKKIVAEGRLESTDPCVLVHHIPLGAGNWKVWVDTAVDPKAPLWRATSEMLTIEDAVGTTIAWHKDFIHFD